MGSSAVRAERIADIDRKGMSGCRILSGMIIVEALMEHLALRNGIPYGYDMLIRIVIGGVNTENFHRQRIRTAIYHIRDSMPIGTVRKSMVIDESIADARLPVRPRILRTGIPGGKRQKGCSEQKE